MPPTLHGQLPQNQKKYSIRDYKPTKLWYERKEVLKDVGLHTPKEEINTRLVHVLKKISVEDPHMEVRKMADELIQSYKFNHDFSKAPTVRRLMLNNKK